MGLEHIACETPIRYCAYPGDEIMLVAIGVAGQSYFPYAPCLEFQAVLPAMQYGIRMSIRSYYFTRRCGLGLWGIH